MLWKQSLVDDIGQSSKDQNADRHTDSTGLTLEASIDNKDSIDNWTIGQVCYIFAENVSIFCS